LTDRSAAVPQAGWHRDDVSMPVATLNITPGSNLAGTPRLLHQQGVLLVQASRPGHPTCTPPGNQLGALDWQQQQQQQDIVARVLANELPSSLLSMCDLTQSVPAWLQQQQQQHAGRDRRPSHNQQQQQPHSSKRRSSRSSQAELPDAGLFSPTSSSGTPAALITTAAVPAAYPNGTKAWTPAAGAAAAREGKGLGGGGGGAGSTSASPKASSGSWLDYLMPWQSSPSTPSAAAAEEQQQQQQQQPVLQADAGKDATTHHQASAHEAAAATAQAAGHSSGIKSPTVQGASGGGWMRAG